MNDNYAMTCPWFQGVGQCDSGCHSEPECQTMEPMCGYKWRGEGGRFAKAPDLKSIAVERERARLERDFNLPDFF